MLLQLLGGARVVVYFRNDDQILLSYIGIPMCTQHQWLCLLCRPEDDRLVGRNMKPYILIIKLVLTYIINFIIS